MALFSQLATPASRNTIRRPRGLGLTLPGCHFRLSLTAGQFRWSDRIFVSDPRLATFRFSNLCDDSNRNETHTKPQDG